MAYARLVVVLCIIAVAFPAAGRASEQRIVVELFTSQGCSSCPPADALLGELLDVAAVLPLSVHVNYWDYIGWRDPFASAETTARQRTYAATFDLRYVYTPQAVVQGQHQFTGSDRKRLMSTIRSIDNANQPAMSLVTTAEGQARITLPVFDLEETVDILVFTFDRHHRTVIARGENRGRTLDNFNVVRHINRVGVWHGEKKTIDTGLQVRAGKVVGQAVLAQGQSTKRIYGAAEAKY